jgi:hypothetical protein
MDVEENGDDHILDAMKYVISWHHTVFKIVQLKYYANNVICKNEINIIFCFY